MHAMQRKIQIEISDYLQNDDSISLSGIPSFSSQYMKKNFANKEASFSLGKK